MMYYIDVMLLESTLYHDAFFNFCKYFAPSEVNLIQLMIVLVQNRELFRCPIFSLKTSSRLVLGGVGWSSFVSGSETYEVHEGGLNLTRGLNFHLNNPWFKISVIRRVHNQRSNMKHAQGSKLRLSCANF